jgi:hypothetical protein
VLEAVAILATLATPPLVATVVTVPEVVKTVAVGFGFDAVAAGAIATAPVVGSAVMVAPDVPPSEIPFCTIKFAFAISSSFSFHYPRMVIFYLYNRDSLSVPIVILPIKSLTYLCLFLQ